MVSAGVPAKAARNLLGVGDRRAQQILAELRRTNGPCPARSWFLSQAIAGFNNSKIPPGWEIANEATADMFFAVVVGKETVKVARKEVVQKTSFTPKRGGVLYEGPPTRPELLHASGYFLSRKARKLIFNLDPQHPEKGGAL
jgi:hypothetical protein